MRPEDEFEDEEYDEDDVKEKEKNIQILSILKI